MPWEPRRWDFLGKPRKETVSKQTSEGNYYKGDSQLISHQPCPFYAAEPWQSDLFCFKDLPPHRCLQSWRNIISRCWPPSSKAKDTRAFLCRLVSQPRNGPVAYAQPAGPSSGIPSMEQMLRGEKRWCQANQQASQCLPAKAPTSQSSWVLSDLILQPALNSENVS